MANAGVEKYLYDILKSISAIREFSKDITDAFDLSRKHLQRSAIERKFEIIGEALKTLKISTGKSLSGTSKKLRIREILSFMIMTGSTIVSFGT